MRRLTVAQALRAALLQELGTSNEAFVYGEGINDPSGFFGTTVGVRDAFGDQRCFDVPNSEESLLGMGVGAALAGLRPVFVNLRVEFLLLAMNQLVNHAARWPGIVGRPIPLPLTVRAIVGRGWGQGAQHSGSYASMLAHVDGLQVAVPSSAAMAAELLVAAMRSEVPTVLVEPKQIYACAEDVLLPVRPAPVGEGRVVRGGDDITLVGVGDAVGIASRVADALALRGVSAEVVDPVWLSPFDAELLRTSVRRTGRVAVIDIGWEAFGLAAEVARMLLQDEVIPLVAPLLSWAPHGDAPAGCFAEADHYPDPDRIAAVVDAMVSKPASPRGEEQRA